MSVVPLPVFVNVFLELIAFNQGTRRKFRYRYDRTIEKEEARTERGGVDDQKISLGR